MSINFIFIGKILTSNKKERQIMSDFETHPLGTRFQLENYHNLIKEIELVGKQYGFGVFPKTVLALYVKAKEQIDNEEISFERLLKQ